jgi:hypothetical protein
VQGLELQVQQERQEQLAQAFSLLVLALELVSAEVPAG